MSEQQQVAEAGEQGSQELRDEVGSVVQMGE